MIIDRILDRKDNIKSGILYNAHDFYFDILAYNNRWSEAITVDMDYGEEEDIKRTLCAYIIRNEYNPLICDYINAVTWLTTTPLETEIKAVIAFEVANELRYKTA